MGNGQTNSAQTITLNKGQMKATTQLCMWWNLDVSGKQFISVSGSAGTGKSTMLKYALQTMNIENMDSSVVFATLTGKAALVLRMKGHNACTIHRLIYKVIEETIPVCDPETNQPLIDHATGKVKLKKILRFEKRTELDEHIKLLVIDEASMVNESMWKDLLSFGKKIILLSDMKQLPPVAGKIIEPVLKPDTVLTEIMRQGKDSDIIEAADMATTGELFSLLSKRNPLNVQIFPNKDVYIISHSSLNDKLLKNADIILCGKNTTRDSLNKYMRTIYGRTSDLPQEGDKLVCRANNYEKVLPNNTEISLINGLIGYVHNTVNKEEIKKETMSIDFKPDFIQDDIFSDLEINIPYIKEKDKQKKDQALRYGKGDKFEYGYAITTHLSQGSEWDKVIIFFEWMGDMQFMKKWLYTAITRAKKKAIIVVRKDWEECYYE